ncbi:Alpha N-terminal protein methyltransferase 1B [Coemansia interrupta]|uniref:Alpha N-terminal protein methyltransferase 1 n=1 Tax=Coemansia interrupta TaxID=1126814 RepID=A0A9W8LNK2_9FUNG|nr:Alpha N-terminal protein methyltransferase 1B [Coemansia interrupta]
MADPRKTEFRPTETWYEDADKYWKGVPSSVDGMLGGLEEVHAPDIRDSLAFMDKLKKNPSLSFGSLGYVLDSEDSSVTRAKSLFESVFAAAGLVVVDQMTQTDFPQGLFEVNMWALKPSSDN